MAGQAKNHLVTPLGRASFVSLIEPREFNGRLAYEISLLFPPGTDLRELEAAINAEAAVKFPHGRPANFHSPLQAAESKKSYQAFKGWTVVKFKSNQRPQVTEPAPNPTAGARVVDCDPKRVYSGCWVRVSYHAFGYVGRKGGNGVTMTLHNVLWQRDDEPLAGSSATEEFDTIDPHAFTGEAPPDTSFLG